jgi:hypothetical protein
MKIGNAIMVVLVVNGLLIGSSILNIKADEPLQLEQGGWMRPSIDEAGLVMENVTGIFRFSLNASGTSPEGTERVEITLGVLNGTEIELAENLWFKEGVVNLLIYGNTLEQVEGTYPWSDWFFEVWFTIPSNEGIEGAVSRLSGFFGVDMSNLSMEEAGNYSMEDIDIQSLTEMFQDNRFYLIARSYNETGAWGQEAFDLTDHMYTALLQFLIDEGLIENPFADDDDDGEEPLDDDNEKEKENGSVSSWILIGIFIIGVTTLLITVSIVLYLAGSSNKNKQ